MENSFYILGNTLKKHYLKTWFENLLKFEKIILK
jgi:hypothetical protein